MLLLCVCAPLRQVTVLPSTMIALDAYTDNPGTWLFHCHLNDHIHGGMMALFNVAGTAPTHNLNGKVCVWGGVYAANRTDDDGNLCGLDSSDVQSSCCFLCCGLLRLSFPSMSCWLAAALNPAAVSHPAHTDA